MLNKKLTLRGVFFCAQIRINSFARILDYHVEIGVEL